MSALAVTVQESRTKSGKTARVAVIPAALVSDAGPERMHWRATELAHQAQCTHYRVMDGSQLVASAKAGALPTQEQTARTHGDGSDWER